MKKITKKIIVRGRVQGVGYRKFTLSKAIETGVSGFVKNDPDNSVYIEAEGNEEQMTIFIKFCHIGPWLSKVRKVEVSELPISEFKGFEIRR